MSVIPEKNADDEDPWENLAEHEDTLEMLAESDLEFSTRARGLLRELEERGLR